MSIILEKEKKKRYRAITNYNYMQRLLTKNSCIYFLSLLPLKKDVW